MKALIILTYCFFILEFYNIGVCASVDDTCGTSGNITINSVPTSGIMKVLVIFAQFKDDPNNEDNGWAKDEYPDWANTYINPTTNGGYSWYNLTHYYNEMSNGEFQVIGDVYDSLVITNYDEDTYNSIGAVNYEILTRIDPYVDFSEYDNLNGNNPGQDGKVDFIYIIYRNSTSSLWWYTAIARLEVSQTINADGVQIVSGSFIGSGVQQTSGYWGRDFTMYNSAHEMGHYLFGSGHIFGISNLGLMNGGPAFNASKGMISWERERLGWIDYTDKTTDGTITLTDYMTTDDVIRVPVSSTECFLIENRKKYSPHDKGGGHWYLCISRDGC
jgi:M6 family metalloprotease-like protein